MYTTYAERTELFAEVNLLLSELGAGHGSVTSWTDVSSLKRVSVEAVLDELHQRHRWSVTDKGRWSYDTGVQRSFQQRQKIEDIKMYRAHAQNGALSSNEFQGLLHPALDHTT